MDQEKEAFDYDGWLLRFAVSLAWRIGIYELPQLRGVNPALADYVDRALVIWSDFLLDQRNDAGPYEHNLFFVTFNSGLENAAHADLPENWYWYMLRGVDGTLPASAGQVWVYTKLPGMIFWSGVNPPATKGWHNTTIGEGGVIGLPQRMDQPGVADFFTRIQIAAQASAALSEKQRKRIRETIQRDPARFASSPAAGVLAAERRLRGRVDRRD